MGVVSVAQTSGKGILHVRSLIFLIYQFCSLFCVGFFFLAAAVSGRKSVAIRVDGFKYYRGQKRKVQT